MALFTGSGSFTLDGAGARVYDCRFTNTGGVTMDDANQTITNCRIETQLTVESEGCHIVHNYFETFLETAAIVLNGGNDQTLISDNIMQTDSE